MSDHAAPNDPERPSTGDADASAQEGESEGAADLDTDALEDLEVVEEAEEVEGGTVPSMAWCTY